MEHSGVDDGVNLRIKSEEEIIAENIRKKIDRMAAIKSQQDALKNEWSELEAFFLQCCANDLVDTKNKSVSYMGTSGKVTATMTESVKVTWSAYLKTIFGEAYKDAVTEKTTYNLSDPAKRMLGGLWSNNYTKITVAEVVAQLPVDDKAKKLLAKKLKGAKFDTDKKNLMVIGGLDESTAEHYAYFVSEAAVWESFCRLMKVNQKETPDAIKETLELINGAVVVEETPKIALELIGA